MLKAFFDKFSAVEQADSTMLLQRMHHIAKFNVGVLVRLSITGEEGDRKLSTTTYKIQTRRDGKDFEFTVELESFTYKDFVLLCEKLYSQISRALFGDTKFLRVRIEEYKEAMRTGI